MSAPQIEHERNAEASDQKSVAMIQCDRLSKRFGIFDALSDCSLEVHQGEVFGLLGPNGAGKTTLIRSLLGYLHPSAGSCKIAGIDPQEDGVGLRKHVSYLPGDARLPRHMKGDSVLKFFAEMHPLGDLEKSRSVAEKLELDSRRRVAFMSTGMRQKLALSVVLGTTTPLLILDEPTANLDPTIRANVLDYVRDAKANGRTVVFSSHVLSEIEATCDRVAFLRSGKLEHELVMSELFQRHRVTGQTDSDPVTVPPELADCVELTQSNRSVQIDTAGELARCLSWIDSLQLRQMRIEPLGLRAVYDAVHAGEEVPV